MKKRRILCLAVSLPLAAFSGIASATPQQSVPLKQAPDEAEIIDLPELVARVKPSVVTILTFDAQGKPAGQGSGFFIAEDRIVTNHHVIRGAARAEIKLNSGTTIEVAGLLAIDESHDLALLKVDLSQEKGAAKIKPLKIATKMPREGERIAVIGSPLGLEHTVSEGIVSAIRELPGFGTIIQMTAAISPGSSGSPVLNMRGEVIAVARSIAVDAQSLNFAVAIEHVAAMQIGKLKRLNELDRQVTENLAEAEEEFARGLAACLANDYQKALIHFQHVVEIEPDVAKVYIALGVVYDKLGRYHEEINSYKKAIQIKPDFALAHSNLGAIYIDQARYQEALGELKRAIRIKPNYADAHYNLGLVYGKLERWQEALDEFKQAIRINPNLAKAHYNLGVSYVVLGRYYEAIDSYKQVVRINPDDGEAHYNLGLVYLIVGKKGLALDEYKILKELESDRANKLFDLIYK